MRREHATTRKAYTMRTVNQPTLSIATLSILVTLALGTAPLAADEAPAFAAPPEPAQVDAGQLDQAAEAYVELNAIQDALAQELSGETDQAVIQERVEAASPDMEAAIVDAGLDVNTYQQLIELISGDAKLRAQFLAKVEALQPGDDTARQQAVPAIGDDELAKAATAYRAINAINQNLQQELEGETDGDAIQQRVAAAETAMQQAVFDAGLEIQDYNTIMQAVQQDAGLQQQFAQLLNR